MEIRESYSHFKDSLMDSYDNFKDKSESYVNKTKEIATHVGIQISGLSTSHVGTQMVNGDPSSPIGAFLVVLGLGSMIADGMFVYGTKL